MSQQFVSLRTTSIIEQASGDRPSFQARVCKTFGSKPYQVFCSSEAMLLLPVAEAAGATVNKASGAVVAGAVLGGMVGAALGSIIADNLETSSVGPRAENFNLMTDDELVAIARQRKGSMLSEYADITAGSIDGPSMTDRMFGNSRIVGNITLRDRTLGKLVLELVSAQSMLTAIKALKTKLGDRLKVDIEWCEQTRTFRNK